MSEFPIQIDARELFYRFFIIPRVTPNFVDSREVQTLQLAPGIYNFQVASGLFADFTFTVKPDGNVDYDTDCDSFLKGRGTSTLTILGLEVTIEALRLTGADPARPDETGVLLANTPLTNEDWIAHRTVHIVPGKGYSVQPGSGLVGDFTFDLKRDGTFAYDPTMDSSQGGFLSGSGTSTLTFQGYPLTVDATAVSKLIIIQGVNNFPASNTGKATVALLPAKGYSLQFVSGRVSDLIFSLGIDGVVNFEPSLAGFFNLEKQGEQVTLRVKGAPIQIDARELFFRFFIIPGVTPNFVDSRKVQTVQLAPCIYNFQIASGLFADFTFTVKPDGNVDYDIDCDSFLKGRGTSTLTILGHAVTIDGSQLTGGSVLLVGGDQIASQTVNLVPARSYRVQPGSGRVGNFTFQLTLDGKFAYDATLDFSQGGFLKGQGSNTLTFLGYPVTVDATAVSDLLIIQGVFNFPVSNNGRAAAVLLPAMGYGLQLASGVSDISFNVDLNGAISFDPSQNDSLKLENEAGRPVLRVRPRHDFTSPIYGAVTLKGAVCEKWLSLAEQTTSGGRSVQEYLGSAVEKTGQAVLPNRAYTVQRFERGMTADLLNLDSPIAVYGAIYLHYNVLGEMGSVLGAPIADESDAPGGGRFSAFENGDIYWRADTGAWEVHGAIRDRWLALGGSGGILGYPISDESPVQQGTTEVGRVSRFEAISRDNQAATVAAIYWTPTTGAFEIYGPILREWQQVQGGPTGLLGFPTSGPQPTPNGQGRFQTFQRGLVVWHPDTGAVTVTGGVVLNLFSYTVSNDDFNVQIDITSQISGAPGPANHGRMPSDGQFSAGSETFGGAPLLTIDQVTPDLVINVNQMEAISENTIGDDTRQGNVAPIVYNIDNAWGLREKRFEHHDGAFSAVLEVQPLSQALAPGVRFRRQLFWPFHNFDTFKLSWAQYEATFRDVAEVDKNISFDPFHPRMHLGEITVYEAVYNALSHGGNCFGMCLEAIYAREHHSLFNSPIFSSNSYRKDGQPLLPDDANPADEPDNAEAGNQINVKQGYQMGSDMISWFLGKWTAGALHDPVRAFRESRDAFLRHDWPILTISDKDKFSQSGHAVLPYAWDPDTEEQINEQPHSGQTWTIFVANPNSPDTDSTPLPDDADSCKIIIRPFEETFSFKLNEGGPVWTGSKEEGGRLLTIPYSMLSSRPTSPADLIADLFTRGVLMVLGGDGKTSQITDAKGRTLYETNGGGIRRVNEDAASRIPGLALLPVHQVSTTPVPELYFWQPDQAAPQLQHALQAGGDHTWTLHSAALSAHVVLTGGAGEAGHQIVVDSLGTAQQTVSLSIPAAGTAKQVEMSLAGWFGTNLAQAKWFELKSMTASPGQTLRIQVLDAGQTLSLHNDGGPDTTFDLHTHFGLTNEIEAVRTNVKIPSGKAWRVELADWTPGGMANVALNVAEMDRIGGVVLRNFQL